MPIQTREQCILEPLRIGYCVAEWHADGPARELAERAGEISPSTAESLYWEEGVSRLGRVATNALNDGSEVTHTGENPENMCVIEQKQWGLRARRLLERRT